ncbi:MAG: hypothetical protein J5753_04200, partial [Oscillospiraceae bacterium]|nr:hypothetical protein [Oscillospiraceae bacterium]
MKAMNRLTALLLGAAVLGGSVPGMPVTAADPSAVQTVAADLQQDTRTAFFERIAGWDNADPADCVILENDLALMLLTPKKPYRIMTGTYLPYRVYLNGGTPDAEEINAKWKQRLEKGYSENFLNKNGGLDAQTCTVEQSGDCWLVTPSQENRFADDLLAVLKTLPAVQRIEVGRSYQTHGRVNSTSEYAVLFTV